MTSPKDFMAVLGKTAQQVADDIDEFVEQFAAAARTHQNETDQGEAGDAQLSESEQDARKAATVCLGVLANIGDGVRNAFDAANRQDYPEGRIIEEAEKMLKRIVQTQAMDCADTGNKKSLDTAAASGLIIRCRKYWRENTDHPMDLGIKPSSRPYGEFLEFVSERFELEPSTLFNRELEIRERERAFKERVNSQQTEPTGIVGNQA